jgi:hypothetical protein
LIQNSTFHGNSGRALSLHENVRLNSVTIVENAGDAVSFAGDLAGTGGNVQVFNAIIQGVCTGAPGAWTAANTPRFNLADASCNFVDATNTPTPATLIATVNPDKTCDGTGRLCPRDSDGMMLSIFMCRGICRMT